MKTKVSNYRTLGEFFFDESIRVDTIIWLSACASQPPEAFTDFLEDEDPKDIKKLLGVKLCDDPEEALSQLARANKQGFLVQASTPIPLQFHGKGNGHTSGGFGYCRLRWFYTEALDSAFAQRLLDWKDTVIAEMRKEMAKSKMEEVSDTPQGPFATFP